MNLCIDIGNTSIKLAIYSKKKKEKFFKRFDKLLVSDITALKNKFNFERVIISSTRNKKLPFYRHLQSNYDTLFLDHKTTVPFKNNYKTPATLGKDRIAAVAGAMTKKKKKTILIVDLGTCITLDVVTKKKKYIGGNISPGINMRLKSMHEFTHALPLVKRKKVESLLGKTTHQAILNGAVFGIVGEIESYIKKLITKYGDINVILTGGDAAMFAELIDYQIFVKPNLVLEGLNEILIINS